jgi:phenolic acid decarboxylase
MKRAQLWPKYSSVKDGYRLSGRWKGQTTNGALAVATTAAFNRARGFSSLTRTGTGVYTLTVQNNPTTAGGTNYTPQWVAEHPNVAFASPTPNLYIAASSAPSVASGVMTWTISTFNTSGVATDVAVGDEISIGVDMASNTVA